MALYSREIDWDALRNQTRFHRFLKISRTLFWAMLIKLSPARRVFLLIVLVVLGIIRVQHPARRRPARGDIHHGDRRA